MDWARTGVMSFGRQFVFHDVNDHMQTYKVDDRPRNIVFTRDAQNIRKIKHFSPKKSYGKF